MSIIAAGTTTTTALSSTGNTDGTLQLQVNGTTPSVTLNTLGAVGVGSTPAFGTSGQVLTSAGSTAAPSWSTNVSSQWTTTGSDIYYNTGNVGIGVTPSAWYTGYTASQVGVNGSVWANKTTADTNIVGIGSNQFLNSGATNRLYISNGFATRYEQAVGAHSWFTAASGTAGNAISFTQAMTLTADGNLAIGTTSANISGGGAGSQALTLSASASARNAIIELRGTRTSADQVSSYIRSFSNSAVTPGVDLQFYRGTADTDGFLTIATSNTERLRIAANGAFGLSGANYGTSGQVLTSGGSGAAPTWATPSSGFTLGTPVATTSGTAIDFTGFPAGTKQIIITFAGVSTDGTSVKIIQIGDSGGIETSGYSDNSVLLRNNAAVLTDSRAAGYSIHSDAAGDLLRGSVTLTLQSSSTNTWVAEGGLFLTGSRACVLAGSKSLTSELTSVRITADNGTDSFDAGSINIAYI
jgi:hypothetical protein